MQILAAPSPSVQEILRARRCQSQFDVLVALERIQGGRYSGEDIKKRKSKICAELGFTDAKNKQQALNDLLRDNLLGDRTQPGIASALNIPMLPLGNASTLGQQIASRM